jgi:hypothetical protein
MDNIEKTLNFIRDKAREYSEALSNREFLKEFRKSKKALLVIEAEQKGLKTQQQRESYAYAHEDYVFLLEGLKEAIEREAYLRHQIKAAELKIEIWRSQNARARAEMNMR